mmetsp:Transcript_49556/g.119349  ORF Transcript_49556/g.119349 Transcript_49556/m.119349 type:complete len:207 (+) Transcript_49556:111-731(+)
MLLGVRRLPLLSVAGFELVVTMLSLQVPVAIRNSCHALSVPNAAALDVDRPIKRNRLVEHRQHILRQERHHVALVDSHVRVGLHRLGISPQRVVLPLRIEQGRRELNKDGIRLKYSNHREAIVQMCNAQGNRVFLFLVRLLSVPCRLHHLPGELRGVDAAVRCSVVEIGGVDLHTYVINHLREVHAARNRSLLVQDGAHKPSHRVA